MAYLQFPLLTNLFIRLHLIANLKALPVLEAHATLCALAHFRDILFDVFKGCDDA